jgi:uncharacterized protein (TIGR02246 family)
MHHDDATKIVVERLSKWAEAFNSGDPRSIAALYLPDAIFCSGAAGVIRGRDAIEKTMAGNIAHGWKIDIHGKDATHLQDDHFVAAGPFTFTGEDGKKVSGNWAGAYAKKWDQWLLSLHATNASRSTI